MSKHLLRKITRFAILIAILLIALNTATALPSATITLNAPSQMNEFETIDLNMAITTNETFNGSITFYAQNLNAAYNPMPILDADFDAAKIARYTNTITGGIIGSNTISINLTASTGEILDSKQISITVIEGEPPIITTASPTGTLTSQSTAISATTNENAECRYSSLDQPYEGMENILGSGFSTTHTTTATFNDGTHNIYIRCNDTNGNVMQTSATITFTITTTPSAEIKLNKESPLTAGIIEVTLVSSKNLADATLSYSFSDSPSTLNNIPLAGSGNLWHGYMIIPETAVTRVGTFTYSGTDTDGRTSAKITNGKLFIVDTSRPRTITDISATGEAGRIKLRWFYDGETGKFNIYKSEYDDVNYVDLYETTNESFFSDKSVNPDKIYYYRIAAVTGSGNVGPLSSIVNAQSEKFTTYYGEKTYNETTNTNPSNYNPEPKTPLENSLFVKKKIEAKLSEISGLLLDAERSEEDLVSTDDLAEKDAIASLGLIDTISLEKEKLVDMQKQILEYKAAYIDEEEFNKTTSFMDVKIKKIKMTIPKKIIITDKSTFVQATDYEDIISASNSALNESEVKNSLADNKQLNEKVQVEVDYKIAKLTYLDDSKETKTIIEKMISYQNAESAKKVTLVETIPKSVAQSADDIEFRTKYVKILKNDPVVALELDELNYDATTLTYILSEEKSIGEIKTTKTVAIRKTSANNKMTGMSIFSIEGDVTFFDWAVVGGVILLVVLVGYYLMFLREEPLRIDRKEMHGLLPGQQEIHTNYGNVNNQNLGMQPNQQYSQAQSYQPASGLNSSNNNFLAKETYAFGTLQKNQQIKTGIKSGAELKRTVNEGNYHIDNMNYALASQAYQEAISTYNSISVSNHERSEIETSLNILYNKLLLLNKISQTHDSLERNDKTSAMMQLDEIARLNNQVTRQNMNTQLAEYSIGWQNKLQKQLLGR